MHRRQFLACSLAGSALASTPITTIRATQRTGDPNGREFYELRIYHLRSGQQVKLANAFFRDALLPALNRLRVEPVGVFSIMIGDEIPSMFVLLPSPRAMALVTLEANLALDAAYQQAGMDFLKAPAQSPAFVRMESKLMIAFAGRPHLSVPPATAAGQPRVFELRTYESPNDRDHGRKVEMFHEGEFDIFVQAGFQPVFYGDTLIGARMPNLTYMLAFDSLDHRTDLWNAFGSSSAWKQLSSSQKYAFEPIVTNITNVILSPTSYSQI
jgi:hypothetical protein